MDDFESYELPPVRQRRRSSRNVGASDGGSAAEDEGVPFQDESSDTLFGENASQMPFLGGAVNRDEFLANLETSDDRSTDDTSYLDSATLAEASRQYMAGLHTMDQVFKASDLETRAARFRVKKLEEENSRLKKEVAEIRRREDGRASEIRRARRRRKREAASIIAERYRQRAADFAEYSDAQRSFGEYCERRGTVGALYYSSQPGFSYEAEIEKNISRMRRRADVGHSIPLIEERIRSYLAPIPVSPDSEEVASPVQRNDEEVTQLPSF